MKCKHENADHLMPGEEFVPYSWRTSTALVEQLRCLDCSHWLGLGPAADTHDDPLVRRALWIEQQALAWGHLAPFDMQAPDCHCDGCQARWLANEIKEVR